MAEVGKIERLQLLYMNNERSDKVWGYFLLTGYSKLHGVSDIWVRFWGKRTASKFGLAETNFPDAHDLEASKLKKGYSNTEHRSAPFSLDCAAIVKDTLWKMFQRDEFIINGNIYYSNTPDSGQTGISLVTGEVMTEFEIRPSEVYKTGFIRDQITFYGKDDNLLGRRPRRQKENIFEHLEKTKTQTRIGPDLYAWK